MSTCKNCRFWISEECHRYPNHFYPVGGDLYFPKVAFFNWCGEWAGIPPCRCTETCKCKEIKDILDNHVKTVWSGK